MTKGRRTTPIPCIAMWHNDWLCSHTIQVWGIVSFILVRFCYNHLRDKRELTPHFLYCHRSRENIKNNTVMKKLLLLIAAVAMLLPSCQKINDELDALGARLDKLENTTIPTISEQISNINTSIADLEAADVELKNYITALQGTAAELQKSIDATNTKIDNVKTALQGEISTAKADVLAQLEALRTEMNNELSQINSTIATLQAKDTELEGKITELRTYVDTELKNTKDWATATFSTLEQHNALCTEIATIKTQIENLNKSISELETRLNTKIATDIATAVKGLQGELAEAVTEITNAYTSSISTAKEEITAAYTTAIQTAINTLDASLKAWVGEQLANYYTIAQIDAMLAAMEQEMNGKLEAQKAYLEGLINELSATLTKSIADNKVLIEGLQKDITTVQGTVAEQASKIAQNASTIAANTQNIIDLSKAIYTNKDNISANEKAIASNKALIEANAKLIAENKSAIEALKNSTSTSIAAYATAIAKNAEDIAKNAALISANAIAINNNAAAIADNAADILQLQQNLAATKAEITEAYQKAINDAITTNNGVIDTKIAAEVSTINTRIDNEVATINSAIETLASRITAVENEIITIQQQIANMLAEIDDIKEDISKLLARIQSISYIPTYDDGKATVKFAEGVSCTILDFEVSPKDAVAELAKVWQSAVSVKAIYTQTRAVSFIDMPIVKFESDPANGVISVTASGENLSAEFFNGTQSASARLSISDGNNSVVSEYVPMIAKEVERDAVGIIPNNEIWYTSSNGNIVIPYCTDYFGASIISNTYNDGGGTIKFDKDIECISLNAFTDCKTLTSIIIPHSVEYIEFGAFYGCSSLTNVTLSDNLKSLDPQSTFSGCTNLTTFYGKHASDDNRCIVIDGKLQYVTTVGISEYTIPDDINTIGWSAFADSGHLKSIIIPSSVTTIEGYAFYNCSSLTNLTISEGVTQIGEYSFSDCKNLTSVTIPNSVTLIGDCAFEGCKNLTGFYGKYASADNRCLIVNGVLNSFIPTELTEYTIPSNVTSIGDSVFSGCSLTSITIPDTVATIGYEAFRECHSLKNVLIGRGVEIIESFAFYNCNSIEHITLPEGLTSIGSYAFDRCYSLASISIGNNVSSIGGCAFRDCTSLTTISIGNSVTSIGSSAFYNCTSLTKVDISDLSAWCKTNFEKEYSNPICRAKKLYLNGELVSELVIPSDVAEVKPYVFYGCRSLTSITIPDSVTSIGSSAFSGCTSLTSITIGNGITSIGSSVFYGCTGELTINSNIPSSRNGIFYNSKFSQVTIGDTVTTIGDYAFRGCSSITNITIGNGVITIGKEAFYGCTGLTSVFIPKKVTHIYDSAFRGCEHISTIYCSPATPPAISGYPYIEPSSFPFNSGMQIYVPRNSYDAYTQYSNHAAGTTSPQNWSLYKSRIQPYDFE